MIPVEVGIPSFRRETYDKDENHTLMSYEFDLLKEKRDLVALRTTSYKQWSERYSNSKIKEKRFKKGDLVLRKVLPNNKEVNARVLEPN